MSRFTKLDFGYPTIWSKWLYPPKNVSTLQYMKAASTGIFKAQKADIKRVWPFWISVTFFGYIAWKISFDWGVGSKYNVSLKSDTGSWFYADQPLLLCTRDQIVMVMWKTKLLVAILVPRFSITLVQWFLTWGLLETVTGPPDPKEVEKRRVHRLLHAPHM